ncbi:MAG: ABC transporter permease [Verrucomicrobia bacterium]|nr:ABC transporter permease [Verrucomicrobiota bacterium]
MRNIRLIAANDLRQFLGQPANYIWLFVLPLTFIFFMGNAMKGPGQPGNARPTVLIDNQDTGFLGDIFLEELDAQGMNLIRENERDSAERTIVIPTDFTRRIQAREPVDITFSKSDNSSLQSALLIEARLIRALVAINSHLVEASATLQTNAPMTETALRAISEQPDSIVLEARFAGRRPIPSGFNQSLPGNLTMFLVMNLLIFGGMTIASERQQGVLRRLAIYPISRWELIAGKVVGLLALAVVVILGFLAAGRWWFGLDIGSNAPAIFLCLLMLAWVAGSFGILLGSISHNPDKIVGLCVLLSMVMAALGGCWWPMEIVPDSMKIVAKCLPTGWTMEALHYLISFGHGFSSVVVHLLVLAGFGLVANLLAARWFRV